MASTRETYVPTSGPMKRPLSVEQAARVLAESAFDAPQKLDNVTLTSYEFTSMCPMTGQPDFGTVTIAYEPDKKCLESKSVKFYLWAFRDEGAFCESLADRIARDVYAAIKPRSVRVTVEQYRRGGITTVAEASIF